MSNLTDKACAYAGCSARLTKKQVRSGTKYHSQSCAGRARWARFTEDERRAWLLRNGRASGEARLAKRQSKVAEVVVDLLDTSSVPEDLRAVVSSLVAAGFARGEKIGYKKGWDAGVREIVRRRV